MKSLLPHLESSFARRLFGVAALGLVVALPTAFGQLYSQNFDSSTSGTVPTGWAIATGGQTWQVSTGTDKTYDSIDQTAGPEVTYYNSASWDTGYTFSADVRLWGSGYGNQVGVVYYFKDTSNYYEVELGGANDPNHGNTNFHLYEHVAGVVTEVDSNFTSPGGGNFVTLQVVRSGTSTTLKVNGTTILTRTQSGLTGGGKIGLVDRYASVKGNNITVSDTQAPTVALTAPANNATVSGSAVAISATAADNIGVSSVQFTLDGGNLQSADTTSPYGITWDSTLATPGAHTLGATAYDAAGNHTSTSINVTVANGLPSGWTASDVGTPGAAGSTTYSSGTGTYIIEGAGTNIWSTADEFQFAKQSITGDCTIIAHVVSIDNTATWSKAGIMIREDTTAGSKYVLLAMTPTRGLLFEARTAAGTSSIQPAVNGSITALPRWLKLVRAGDTFSASYSSDGVIWTSAGMVASGTSNRQSTVNVKMNATLSAGLAVCSTVHSTLCTATFDNVSATANSNFAPAYPRLGIYAISGSGSVGQAYDTAEQGLLAKFHVAVIGGSYEGWYSGRAYTRETAVSGIKTSSMIGTKVYQYVILEESTSMTGQQSQLPTWDARATTNGWWLLEQGTGNKVVTGWPAYQINMTQYAPNDSVTAQRPFAWGASFVYDMFADTGGSYGPSGNAAPSLDGFYLDNVFPYAKVTGDWDRDNVANDPDDFGFTEFNNYGINAASWWRAGQLDFFNQMRTLMPGKWQMGNTAEFANIARPTMTDLNKIGVLNQALNGGLLEPAVGIAGAPEGWGSPNYVATVEQYYKYTMDSLAAPKLLIFEDRVAKDGSDSIDASTYRPARYGLALCLMNNGYYDPNNTQSPHTYALNDMRWFDEMSVYNGVGQAINGTNVNAGLGYLGAPVANTQGGVQTGPRWTGTGHGSMGVWAREFEGGIAIVNPRGNGSVTITVGASGTDLNNTAWKRISGTQDSTVNSGADVTSNITLADRDAIILLRK